MAASLNWTDCCVCILEWRTADKASSGRVANADCARAHACSCAKYRFRMREIMERESWKEGDEAGDADEVED